MSRYSLWVGVAFVALIGYATFNTIQSDDGGVLGTEDTERGLPLQEFAVPDARGELQGDANIAQDDCETAENPCPADAQRTPACQIQEPDAIKVCDLFDKPLAISFWFTRGGDCLPAQDRFNAAAGEYGDQVNFLSVNVRDDIERVREIVAERGWSVPVGWDRDGAVSNIYRVGVCPTIALAYPGGILQSGQIGELTDPQLSAALEELIAESREREAVR